MGLPVAHESLVLQPVSCDLSRSYPWLQCAFVITRCIIVNKLKRRRHSLPGLSLLPSSPQDDGDGRAPHELATNLQPRGHAEPETFRTGTGSVAPSSACQCPNRLPLKQASAQTGIRSVSCQRPGKVLATDLTHGNSDTEPSPVDALDPALWK